MSVNSYQENSWSWQVYQFQQKIGEWLEYQISKITQSLAKGLPSLGLDWLNFPRLENIVYFLLWTLLVLIILVIIRLLWQEFKPYFFWLLNGQKPQSSPTKNQENIARENWVAKAEQYQRQGDYQQACLCLYQAMLQSVDQRKIVAYQASRTDGEYWSSLQVLPSADPYYTLLDIHQDLCFGGSVASFETWKLCRTAYGEIEKK